MDIRYVVLDSDLNVIHRFPRGYRVGRWDFTLPGPLQGGRIIDLDNLTADEKEKYL